MMISRSTVFLSSRTLPFQRRLLQDSSAAGVNRCGRRLFSRLNRSAKCRTSAGMSSRRSRSGGTRIGIDAQAEVEVLAERALLDLLLEVLVRRGDHADVHLDRSRRPRRSTSPSWSTRSTLACVFGAHVADLVEEDRAAVGLLELADLLLGRAGERALLVAEQLRFDQLLGNRGAVDLHEPLAAAEAVAVDRARDELLADAALAEQQHGRVGRRRALDRVPAPAAAPGSRRPSGVATSTARLQRPVLVAQPRLIERVADRDEHALAGERLLDEVERAGLGRLDGGRDRAVARDHHDRQRRRSTP